MAADPKLPPPGKSSAETGSTPQSFARTLRRAGRQWALPIGAVMMVMTFYVYSRTTVQAAKANAQRYREADGGSINWRNENLRRHGVLKKPDEITLWQQLTSASPSKISATQPADQGQSEAARPKPELNFIEEGIRKAREQGYKARDEKK